MERAQSILQRCSEASFTAGLILNAWVLLALLVYRPLSHVYNQRVRMERTLILLVAACLAWAGGSTISSAIGAFTSSMKDRAGPIVAWLSNLSVLVMLLLNVLLAMDRFFLIVHPQVEERIQAIAYRKVYLLMVLTMIALATCLIISPSIDGFTPDNTRIFHVWLAFVLLFYFTSAGTIITYYLRTFRFIQQTLIQTASSASASSASPVEQKQVQLIQRQVSRNMIFLSAGVFVFYIPLLTQLIGSGFVAEDTAVLWQNVSYVLVSVDTVWTPVLILSLWAEVRDACFCRRSHIQEEYADGLSEC
ncbi:hypothetical protein BJ741DRAFT_593432 [Chytriomyces cf. hyalinus JEL632]|nr:hypothetical protein BJ741DRAFT_593432 [Chytriomyces cf. hyalinus JEL632]